MPRWDVEIRPLQGRRFRASVTVAASRDEHGNILSLRWLIRDTTDRWRAENEIRLAAEELKRSNQDLEQFAYVASHDLQEPLRMVRSFLGLLRGRYEGKLGADADQYIGFAVEGAERMSVMIKDLLEYSRAGRGDIKPEAVDFNRILEQAKANLQAAIDESGAVIAGDPLPTVPADAARMTQVFQNLIGNAIKFRAEGRPPKVTITACNGEGVWIFSVKDNGIGIDPAQTDRIFQVFQRLHTRDKYPGSGIGLAICKKIIERHGGRIWMESQPGQGTTFLFTIPDRGTAKDDEQDT